MRFENGISMLTYLRRAITIWKEYPFALTAPLVVAIWLNLPGPLLLHRLSGHLRSMLDLFLFALCCIASYVARTFASRVVGDLEAGISPDWRRESALCFRPVTFRIGAGLFWRFLLWFLLALSVVGVAAVMVLSVGTIANHKVSHHALGRLVVWAAIPIVAACIAKYSFAIPYLAFSGGAIAHPISLSIMRTKRILRPLTWLVVCESGIVLTISQLFRTIGSHLALSPPTEMAWNMLRDAVEAIPETWLVIAIALIAYSDFAAMQDGGVLAARDGREIELIDGLPAYQPPTTRHSIGG